MAIKTLNYKQIPLLDTDKIDGLGDELASKVAKPSSNAADADVKYIIKGNGGAVKLSELTHADLTATQIKYGAIAGRTVADEIAELIGKTGTIGVPKGQLHLYIGDNDGKGILSELTTNNVPVPASVTTALSTINDKIDEFESLGHIIGSTETYATLLTEYPSTKPGLTANDMVIVKNDVSDPPDPTNHKGGTYIYTWNGSIWTSGFKFNIILEASAIVGFDDAADARIEAAKGVSIADKNHSHTKADLTGFDDNAFAAVKTALGLSSVTSDGKLFAITHDGTDFSVTAIPAAKTPSLVQEITNITTTAHQLSFPVNNLLATDKVECFINGVYNSEFSVSAGQVSLASTDVYNFDVGETVTIIVYRINNA